MLFRSLKSVKNPVAASGGADAETIEGLRTFAPKSALILGRVVSIQDFEAVVLSFAGVEAAKTEWVWDENQLQAVVNIWYVGAEALKRPLLDRLIALKDPTTPIKVQRATPQPVRMTITVAIDPRFVADKVLADVYDKLMKLEKGTLRLPRIGIGKPIYRSQLFADVLAVEGVLTITDISWENGPLSIFGKKPNFDKYFDFKLTVNQ